MNPSTLKLFIGITCQREYTVDELIVYMFIVKQRVKRVNMPSNSPSNTPSDPSNTIFELKRPYSDMVL
ncbi:MAG: hypothetical protein WBQ25_18605 [Nitrososphaeraceae archaeon]